MIPSSGLLEGDIQSHKLYKARGYERQQSRSAAFHNC